MSDHARSRSGFTLIELSIVLVIIGLLLGGVLVGQTLIAAAMLRNTATQIERYNTAANTFFGKYGVLPGDATALIATQFGFVARAGSQGQGDGNGLIEGYDFQFLAVHSFNQTGEPFFLWEDLSSAGLIDGSFSTYVSGEPAAMLTSATLGNYLPAARLGNSNYFYAYSWNLKNYFALTQVTQMTRDGHVATFPGLTVMQAYLLDSKLDDGSPITGRVLAMYPSGSGSTSVGQAPNAAMPSSTTCYDTTSNQYSITQSNGANVNCALSFRFQ